MQRYKPSKGPVNYREQPGCETCGHVFTELEYESGPYFYCHKDRSKRPRCGSGRMKEGFHERKPKELKKDTKSWSDMTKKEQEAAMEREYDLNHRSWCRYSDKWEAWSEPREVDARGICDAWIPQEAN